jgi:uncharacterized membrane protein
MDATWLHQLKQWHEFFLLSGTAGGILTGVLFVVISLGPSLIAADNAISVRACVSPNAVHFTAVLVVSNSLMAHGVPRELIGWLLCLGAALTLLYLWSIRGQQPWHESGISLPDKVWYILLPHVAYILLLIAGAGVLLGDTRAVLLIAAVIILLMVIGIRNAWDLAVWMPVQEFKAKSDSSNPAAPGDA